MILLRDREGSDNLRTLTLIPQGTAAHRDKDAEVSSEPFPGNAQDRLNLTLGMALHATLLETVEGILDGGLRRDDARFLRSAGVPAATLNFPNRPKPRPR